MRLSHYTDKKGIKRFYVIQTKYDENGKEHSVTVEKLGTETEIQNKYHMDALTWAKQHVAELNKKEKEEKSDIIVSFPQGEIIEKDYQCKFNVGYLFLKKIYHELKLNLICKHISKDYKFDYNLCGILESLIYGRIIHPTSKKSTFEFSKTLLEAPDFELHDVYRALDVFSEEFYSIQTQLYKNSFALGKRKTGVIYYDCTNFFFECEEPDGKGKLRQYGKSKENRPLPIVEMGMFIDSEGIPLAMCIHPGNTNEQATLKPIEKKLLSEHGLSKFVFCADAGLSSAANKRYNSVQDRSFVVTQSIKKLKKEYREWALSPEGWSLAGSTGSKDYSKKFNLNEIDEDKYFERIFYKECWVDHGNFEEKILVTYSIKYKRYQRNIRNTQIARAEKAISEGAAKLSKKTAQDFRRFIEKISITEDGEIAEKTKISLNQDRIDEEEKYDGFYAVCTDLDDEVENIIKINKYRWKIEECFRIMKTDFESRPVYVSNQGRIKAHFLTCYLSLVVYRYLEKRLENKYTTSQIIGTLKDMEMVKISDTEYIPAYMRNDITDALHEMAGFRTDYKVTTKKKINEILRKSKKHNA